MNILGALRTSKGERKVLLCDACVCARSRLCVCKEERFYHVGLTVNVSLSLACVKKCYGFRIWGRFCFGVCVVCSFVRGRA